MTDQESSQAGERIRLPSGSLQPILIAAGLALLLIGVLGLYPLSVIGLLLMIAAIFGWIRASVRAHRELPSGHED
jgi:Flp pilus assembly protein TadB